MLSVKNMAHIARGKAQSALQAIRKMATFKEKHMINNKSLLAHVQNKKYVLQSPYSAGVNRDYILGKKDKYKDKFDIKFCEAHLGQRGAFADVIDRECEQADPEKPKFLMLRSAPISAYSNDHIVHSIGAVLYQGKVYLTGTLNKVDVEERLTPERMAQYHIFKKDEFPRQGDDVSCDLLAYKQGKYLIEALLRGDKVIDEADMCDQNDDQAQGKIYTPLEQGKKYGQVEYPLHLKEHQAQWKVLQQEMFAENSRSLPFEENLQLTGNSRLAARNIKRFFLHSSKDRLKAFVTKHNIHSVMNGELKEIVANYLCNLQSREDYQDKILLHFKRDHIT